MRLFISGLFLCLGISLGFALNFSPSVSPFINLADSNSIVVVEKVNLYQLLSTFMSDYYDILEMSADRVFMEFQLGFCGNYTFTNSQYAYNGSLCIKINLFNPKLPYSLRALNKMEKLEEEAGKAGFALSDLAVLRMEAIKKELRAYNDAFWYKRFSIGIGLPFYYPQTNANDLSDRLFYIDDVYAFIGYDLGDIITLQLGISGKQVFIGASLDLTTSLYTFGKDFANQLQRLFGLGEYTYRGGTYVY